MIRQFFQSVEELSPEHFLVLSYAENPGAWFDAKGITRPNFTMSGHRNLLEKARLPVDGQVLEIILRDLNDRGLANTDGLGVSASARTIWGGWCTSLGTELLQSVADI
jgi:hypothetical protein